MGRVDDVINVSGHRIGTMEVESALVAYKSVAEAVADCPLVVGTTAARNENSTTSYGHCTKARRESARNFGPTA